MEISVLILQHSIKLKQLNYAIFCCSQPWLQHILKSMNNRWCWKHSFSHAWIQTDRIQKWSKEEKTAHSLCLHSDWTFTVFVCSTINWLIAIEMLYTILVLFFSHASFYVIENIWSKNVLPHRNWLNWVNWHKQTIWYIIICIFMCWWTVVRFTING